MWIYSDRFWNGFPPALHGHVSARCCKIPFRTSILEHQFHQRDPILGDFGSGHQMLIYTCICASPYICNWMMLWAYKCGYILTGIGMVSPSLKKTGFRPVLQHTILELPYFSTNSIKEILYLGILDGGTKVRICTSVIKRTFMQVYIQKKWTSFHSMLQQINKELGIPNPVF